MRALGKWGIVLGIGLVSCGGRDSLGEARSSSTSGATSTMTGGSMTTDTGGSTTETVTTGTTTSTGGFGGSGAGRSGAGGAPVFDGSIAPPPDVATPPMRDASIDVDLGRLGGGSCGGIQYPETAFYGTNVLYPTFSRVADVAMAKLELAARLGAGATLQIGFTNLNPPQRPTPGTSGWGIGIGGDWRSGTYDFSTGQQRFEAKFSGQMNESTFLFVGSGSAKVEYFECGAMTPTATKVVSWGP